MPCQARLSAFFSHGGSATLHVRPLPSRAASHARHVNLSDVLVSLGIYRFTQAPRMAQRRAIYLRTSGFSTRPQQDYTAYYLTSWSGSGGGRTHNLGIKSPLHSLCASLPGCRSFPAVRFSRPSFLRRGPSGSLGLSPAGMLSAPSPQQPPAVGCLVVLMEVRGIEPRSA